MQVDVDGLSIKALLEGPETAPVVTLSHSLAAHLDMWRPQMAALVEHFRVLRYDVRGHGGSSMPAGMPDIADLADDIRRLLDYLGISRTHFVGLSMGGMIGQQLAIAHPEYIESLVLADTLSAYGEEHRAMWQARIDAAMTGAGMEPLVEPTIQRWFTEPFRRTNPAAMDWIRSMIRATPPQGFIGCCHALMALNLTDQLPAITAPTLVMVGRQDPTTPVAGAALIAAAISHARLVIIEDAAHIANVEQPEVFTHHLLDFLLEQRGRGNIGSIKPPSVAPEG
ncbi:3-oxoadipate enol-lactonase [Chelatococcus asaccharovorans]|uniref:3-oxoadipate enol-lactonase n=1 Tax=Chelatococcus asaccharovorans TaxID=28210 RepID=UPI00224C6566|nr:3-oxoadipate enol-lactonase [Chelatococcus asaccharovorans]CAH1666029.1 Beta-ketoadipate enol-lactone hydrolase [Chelatococcus asaccharovorans]CAH1681665.1 Beta-ketoadipate enol-lactone hydrolase [Chelatococcus asaccharovorans]